MSTTTSTQSESPQIGQNLSRLLADEYTLLLKTQNCHWNVEGPFFYSLHLLFEQQYKALQDKVDTLAERIRALKQRAPASYQEYNQISKVKDAPAGQMLNAHQMIDMLTKDHEVLIKDIHDFRLIAEKQNDPTTSALYDDLALFHQKAAWMIRSHRS